MDSLIKRLDEMSLRKASFVQALSLSVYCSLVGLVIYQGERVFGRMANFWGPLTFLILFCTSALMSALLTLGYPFIVFWVQKKPKKAISLVSYTTGWLLLLLMLLMLTLIMI